MVILNSVSLLMGGPGGGGGASTTVLHSKRVNFISNFACTLIFTHNESLFSSSISVQSIKQRPLCNRSYDEL